MADSDVVALAYTDERSALALWYDNGAELASCVVISLTHGRDSTAPCTTLRQAWANSAVWRAEEDIAKY